MRKYFGFLLLASGIALVPTYSWSQFQFPGGRSKMSMDPDEIFAKYSNGKDVIVFSELDARDQQKLNFLSSMVGIKIGERTTREEFKQHFTKVTSMVQSGSLTLPGKGGLGSGGAPTTPPATGVAPPTSETPKSFGPARSPGDREALIESMFRKMDKNNDGNLTADEIPENMQREREAYDTNHDGFVDLTEFKNFIATVRPPRDSDSRPADGERPAIEPRDGDSGSRLSIPEDHKPTVYRVGKLPKDLPEWFVRLDKQGDCDGQVGLWEVRNEKSLLDDFNKYDLNGDGLITAEEVLRYKASIAKKTEASDTLASTRDRGGSSRTTPASGSSGMQTFTMPSVAVPPTTINLTTPAPATTPPTTVTPPSGGNRPFGGLGSGNGGFRGFSGFGKGSSGNAPRN